MKGPRITSIRLKITLLVLGSLFLTFIVFSWLATSIVAEDKITTIYEYHLSELKAVGDAVDHRIQKIITLGQMISTLVGGSADRNDVITDLYTQASETLSIQGMVFMSPLDGESFSLKRSLGEDPSQIQQILADLGWSPEVYDESLILQETTTDGTLALGTLTFDAKMRPLAFLAMARISDDLIKAGEHIQVFVMDSDGTSLASESNLEKDESVKAEEIKPLIADIAQNDYESGIQEWARGDFEYIVGFKRLPRELMVLSFIPKAYAYVTATELVRSTIGTGLGILTLAMLVTSLFVRSLTKKIKALWIATEKVKDGDFSFRVETQTRVPDEMTELGNSFNTMAGRIASLLKETAEKARMEKELETAQLVQRRFFPVSDWKTSAFELSGSVIPATECSGDWWYYKETNSQLVVVIGDVTGHGVSSALITAAAHTAFSILTSNPSQALSASLVMERLNDAVYSAAAGTTNMSMQASVIDLNTGILSFINADHRPMYIYRKTLGLNGKVTWTQQAVQHPLVPALGRDRHLRVEAQVIQLEPEDLLFWYTDGLLECRNLQGKAWHKKDVIQKISGLLEQESFGAQEIHQNILISFREFIGGSDTHLEDDVTVVFGKVPKSAHFLSLAA